MTAAFGPVDHLVYAALDLDDGVARIEALSWRLTDPGEMRCDGIVPFLIDWLDSPHPAAVAPGGCELVGLRAEHPDPACALPLLAALDVALGVSQASTPALIATIRTPAGVIELH